MNSNSNLNHNQNQNPYSNTKIKISQDQDQDLNKSKNVKLPAKTYMDKHNLEPILSELLNTLVSKRINKPEGYMVKILFNYYLIIKFCFEY